MNHPFDLVRGSFSALAVAVFCLAAIPADAAGLTSKTHHWPQAAKAPPAATLKSAEATVVDAKPIGVWTSGEQERACIRIRRKLWQDGEGWVVKRVSVCP